ncbi:hypothetical protein VZT92_021747 [Zoarces viviparus]|uniref:Secreted protein n=1 Tax=Zoarces viviparus TaxID=48416 RepID=A0AAW1E917_ZOAVI
MLIRRTPGVALDVGQLAASSWAMSGPPPPPGITSALGPTRACSRTPASYPPLELFTPGTTPTTRHPCTCLVANLLYRDTHRAC